MYNYADLPAFLLNISPTNLTPFPLYGSGALKERIFAATCPTNCLSKEVNLIIGSFPFSDIVSTLTSGATSKTILCEKPKARSN